MSLFFILRNASNTEQGDVCFRLTKPSHRSQLTLRQNFSGDHIRPGSGGDTLNDDVSARSCHWLGVGKNKASPAPPSSGLCGLKKAGSVDPPSRRSAVSRNVGLRPNSLDGPADAKYMGGGAGLHFDMVPCYVVRCTVCI
jgi:hypothetical protein